LGNAFHFTFCPLLKTFFCPILLAGPDIPLYQVQRFPHTHVNDNTVIEANRIISVTVLEIVSWTSIELAGFVSDNAAVEEVLKNGL